MVKKTYKKELMHYNLFIILIKIEILSVDKDKDKKNKIKLLFKNLLVQ